jgi:hypothetical protein
MTSQTSIELIDVVAAAHLMLRAQEQILGDFNLGRVCLMQLIQTAVGDEEVGCFEYWYHHPVVALEDA